MPGIFSIITNVLTGTVGHLRSYDASIYTAITMLPRVVSSPSIPGIELYSVVGCSLTDTVGGSPVVMRRRV